MDNLYEKIIPWNGANDTGKDVRLKLERNFAKIGLNFNEVLGKLASADELFALIAEELENRLSKKTADTAAKVITFIEGLISQGLIEAKGGIKLPSGAALYSAYADGTLAFEMDENGFVIYEKGTANKWSVITHAGAEFQNLVIKLLAQITDLEVSNKTTTLNLLVKELAGIYNLDVSNVATLFRTIIKDYVSSETFIAGLAGEGFKLYKALSGDWNLELDNLTIRKAMTVFELIISKIRAVNGGLVVSQANGRVKSVNEDATNYVLGIEGNMTFEADDFVRCQVFGTIGAKYYWVRLVSASGDSITIPKSEFPEGTVPAVGDDLVQMGNKTNTARQGILYLTASEDGKPRFSVLDGVNSTDLTGKNKLILGCLDGITDSDFPSDAQPSGYGLWAVNVFLKGLFILRNGKSVEDELSDQITAVRTAFEIREGQISSKVTEATTAATNAGNSAILAQGYANTAGSKASDAEGSATIAGQKAAAAAGSATIAGQKASDAQAAAADAADILSRVTTKESSINQTASNIALQVGEVTTKVAIATNAANTATTKAGEASTSATNAANSATSAAGSASAASNVLVVVTTKQSEINQAAGNITLQVTEVTAKTVQATNAAELATAMSKGKMLYRDPTLVSGLNGISVYNNLGNGMVTHARVSGISGNPNGSGYCLRITTSGSASPGWGGFFFGTGTKANQVLVVRFVANIPSGYTVEFASNAIGDGDSRYWLTDHAGTGKWEEYAFKVVCGSTGSFSSTNFFYLSGGSTPTASVPLIWYVCYATVFDMTDVDDIPTRTEASNDATSKANTAENNAKTYSNDTFTTKTEFSSQLTILNNSISTKVSQTDFNALGTTVSNHTSTINQLPTTIDARITTQVADGGIIKTNVESMFSMVGNTMYMGAKSINISGATVFSSLATQAQAQGYASSAQSTAISTAAADASTKANNALSDAKSYSDTLINSLGSLAYDNAVSLAKLDTTIVEGGYIKTSLINAAAVVTGQLIANLINATDITTGRLTVTTGAKIGGWSVSGNSLYINSSSDAKILVEPSGSRFLRINDSASALMNIRADGVTGISIYTQDVTGTCIYMAAQTGSTAIESYGGCYMRARSGEIIDLVGNIRVGGLSVNTVRSSGNVTLNNDNTWFTAINTSTVYLPPSPTVGKTIFICRGAHVGVTVYGNGRSICRSGTSYLSSLSINTDGEIWVFHYDGSYWMSGCLNN